MTAPLTTRPNVRPQDIATSKRLWLMVTDYLTQMGGNLGEAVAADGSPIQQVYGVQELHSAASWPRVVWVASADGFGPATLLAGGGPRLPVKPSYTRIIGVAAYLHGADSDTAEMMANDYISLLHKIFGATVVIQGGGLVGEDEDQGESTWLRDGAAYRLSFGIMVPVAPIANFAALRNPALYDCQDQEVR